MLKIKCPQCTTGFGKLENNSATVNDGTILHGVCSKCKSNFHLDITVSYLASDDIPEEDLEQAMKDAFVNLTKQGQRQ